MDPSRENRPVMHDKPINPADRHYIALKDNWMHLDHDDTCRWNLRHRFERDGTL